MNECPVDQYKEKDDEKLLGANHKSVESRSGCFSNMRFRIN